MLARRPYNTLLVIYCMLFCVVIMVVLSFERRQNARAEHVCCHVIIIALIYLFADGHFVTTAVLHQPATAA